MAEEKARPVENLTGFAHSDREAFVRSRDRSEQFPRERHHCTNSPTNVTLSAGGNSRSELPPKSKGPYPMHRERKSYCTYIMGSLSGTLYIGITGNLHKRVFEHKFHRIAGFTDKYNVERLLYSESFDDVQRAINREKQLKSWRRSKKIALIEFQNPHWLDLSRDWFPWMKDETCRLKPKKMSS